MKKLLLLVGGLFLLASHDLFLKLDTYFLPPNSPVTVQLFNGSFETSENVITRDRMLDVSLLGNGQRNRVDTTQWREKDNATLLDLTTGAPGTYVLGVSTRARNIELTAEKFNSYLEHDGVLDMLERRKTSGTLDQDATEQYAKHVKTIFQVGNRATNDPATPLGYPIEFILLDNPYGSHAGHDLRAQLLWQGEPLPNQLVFLGKGATDHGHDHAHDGDPNHSHQHGTTQLRTDANGMLTVNPSEAGIWYLRTIYMTESDAADLTHVSEWATLTFKVAAGDHDHAHAHADGEHHHHDGGETHSHSDGTIHSYDDGTAHTHADGTTHTHSDGTTHSHDHDHEGGLPSYVWWIGSLAVIGVLFFVFNRRTA